MKLNNTEVDCDAFILGIKKCDKGKVGYSADLCDKGTSGGLAG